MVKASNLTADEIAAEELAIAVAQDTEADVTTDRDTYTITAVGDRDEILNRITTYAVGYSAVASETQGAAVELRFDIKTDGSSVILSNIREE